MSSSDSNDGPQRQPTTGQQGSRQGRSPQGGQSPPPQQSQGRGQTQGGRRQPPGGGGSAFSSLSNPESKQYLIGIIGTLVVLSLATFVMILLLGGAGGPSVTSEQLQDADLSSEQESQLQDVYTYSIVSGVTTVSPYLAFAVVVPFGLLIGRNLSEPLNDKIAVSGVGAFAGTVVFVILVVFLSSTQIPDLSSLPSQMQSPLAGSEVDFGQLIINSILIGISATVVAVGSTYFSHRMEHGQ